MQRGIIETLHRPIRMWELEILSVEQASCAHVLRRLPLSWLEQDSVQDSSEFRAAQGRETIRLREEGNHERNSDVGDSEVLHEKLAVPLTQASIEIRHPVHVEDIVFVLHRLPDQDRRITTRRRRSV